METIRVLIVEDDFMVADINRQVTEQVAGFTVIKVVLKGQEGLSVLEAGGIDLVLLDVYLPDINGIDFIKTARQRDFPVDFILVTAAQDTGTVEQSMRYGVIDYLIKPFDFDRYKTALSDYRRRRVALGAGSFINQNRLDAAMERQPVNHGEQNLPKGISPPTLAAVTAFLDKTAPVEILAADLVSGLTLSRITARRYLEYLAETGVLRKEVRYQKVGRPQVYYTRDRR